MPGTFYCTYCWEIWEAQAAAGASTSVLCLKAAASSEEYKQKKKKKSKKAKVAKALVTGHSARSCSSFCCHRLARSMPLVQAEYVEEEEEEDWYEECGEVSGPHITRGIDLNIQSNLPGQLLDLYVFMHVCKHLHEYFLCVHSCACICIDVEPVSLWLAYAYMLTQTSKFTSGRANDLHVNTYSESCKYMF